MSENTDRVLSADEQAELRIQFLSIQLLQSQLREAQLQQQNAQMVLELTQQHIQELQTKTKSATSSLVAFQQVLNDKYSILPTERVDDDGRVIPRT